MKKEVRKPFHVLLGRRERVLFEKAAKRANLPLATWMRSVCTGAAKEIK